MTGDAVRPKQRTTLRQEYDRARMDKLFREAFQSSVASGTLNSSLRADPEEPELRSKQREAAEAVLNSAAPAIEHSTKIVSRVKKLVRGLRDNKGDFPKTLVNEMTNPPSNGMPVDSPDYVIDGVPRTSLVLDGTGTTYTERIKYGYEYYQLAAVRAALDGLINDLVNTANSKGIKTTDSSSEPIPVWIENHFDDRDAVLTYSHDGPEMKLSVSLHRTGFISISAHANPGHDPELLLQPIVSQVATSAKELF